MYSRHNIAATAIASVLLSLPGFLFSGCAGTLPEQGSENVAFYVNARPQVKGVVENSESLVQQALPLYVTEDGTGNSFVETKLSHTANGVWRSDRIWQPRNYIFFAYVRSSTDSPLEGLLDVKNQGRTVEVTQPYKYSTDPSVYADFLLSYRVEADGADKPLVRLELERITTCVELYMTASPAMSSVRLKKAEFSNIFRQAKYNIAYHAASGDQDKNGLKNSWNVSVDQATMTTYTHAPTGGILLKTYDPGKGRYDSANRVMSFLTVRQSLLDNQNHILNLTYEVTENGIPVEYNVSFDLGNYPVKSWEIGHKIRYYVSVDTSIDLEGTIEPWKTVESIEGTFLPD